MWILFLLFVFLSQLLFLSFGFYIACRTAKLWVSQLVGVIVCLLISFVIPFAFFFNNYLLTVFSLWSVVVLSYWLIFIYEDVAIRIAIILVSIVTMYAGGFVRFVLKMINIFIPIDVFHD